MDEKLIATIKKIKILSKQNHEFAQEMRKMFGNTSSASVVHTPDDLIGDVSAIREALEIRANKSISYDFVREQRLRNQLIIDNLRMENAALDLQKSEEERFYTFCVNAFYQLENVVNYYFYVTYPEIKELVLIIEKYTEQEKNGDYRYKRSNKEKSVADIPIVHKINAVCNIIFPGDSFKYTLNTLRRVRNKGEHRCMIITQQEKDENDPIYIFFQKNTFNSVRIALIKIVNAIRGNIKNPIYPSEEKTVAIITNILPSTCFVKFNDKSEQLPNKLLPKIKGKQKNDSIILSIVNGKIIDVLS